MAKITAKQIEQINEVYARCKVKTQTAKIVGVSVASVNKYLIPNYVPRAERKTESFNMEPPGPDAFIERIKVGDDFLTSFRAGYILTEQEMAELKELQKEIY